MAQPEFWSRPEVVDRYVEMESGPAGRYEREVNGPSVASLIPLYARSVLDFGCGPGFLAGELSFIWLSRKRHPTWTMMPRCVSMLALHRGHPQCWHR